jgi:hypothetical protein
VQFCCDSEGVGLNYEVMSAAVSSYRRASKIKADWKAEIEEDFKERGKK